MRPALHRLLARPSSLELLRLLVGSPVTETQARRCVNGKRRISALALKQDDVRIEETEDGPEWKRRQAPVQKLPQSQYVGPTAALPKKHEQHQFIQANATSKKATVRDKSSSITLRPIHEPGYWRAKALPMSTLELESNLADSDSARLLNQIEHACDLDLWIHLLEYRKNRYGSEGVMMFWEAIICRGVRLPVRREDAEVLWNHLLDLEYDNIPQEFAEKICEYADKMHQLNDFKWRGGLYLQIMRHLLVNSNSSKAISWHKYLERYHAPSDRNFARLCYEVISQHGNMPALMEIYKLNRHRNLYDKIIQKLCATEQFRLAVQWHHFLLKNGDLPTSLHSVQPLLTHLTTYGKKSCSRLVQSLEDSKVPFVSDIHSALWQITPQTSQDFVSEVRSKTFHVREKEYNDNLGARWLATGWVSLETAIKTIHALGVREIGPLSLQSIVLREPHVASIVSRIEMLESLGISLGKSNYSRAIRQFAFTGRQDALQLLLESDQHPTSFDDRRLQERLLRHFGVNNEWANFRLTLDILSIDAPDSSAASQNLLLRLQLERSDSRDFDSIHESVLDILSSGIALEAITTRQVLISVLGSRSKGHRPNYFHRVHAASVVANAYTILREIVYSRSPVPISIWQEIIRRFGMMGNFAVLERLILQIADWYGRDGIQNVLANVPSELSTNNPAHPLRQLFSDSFQMAVVEWAFIHYLSLNRFGGRKAPSDMLTGIKILNKLAAKGVFVNQAAIRKGVLNRLVIYYGKGESNKPRNREAKARLNVSLEDLTTLVNQELKGQAFPVDEIRGLVEKTSTKREKKAARKAVNDLVRRARTGRPVSKYLIEKTLSRET